MAIKTKKIAYRFLLQSIISVLIITIVMASLYLSDKHKQEAHKVIIQTNRLHSIGEDMVAMLKNVSISQRMDPAFCEETADQFIQDNVKISEMMHDGLLELSQINIVNNNEQDAVIIDSIARYTELWKTKFEQYVLSLKILGNINGGLQKEIFDSIKTLSKELDNISGDRALSMELYELRDKLIGSQSVRDLDQLINYCDNLSLRLSEYENIEENMLSEKVTSLVEILKESKSTELRIIADNENSQIHYLTIIGNDMLLSISGLEDNMTKKLSNYFFRWSIVYVVTGIFFMIIIVVTRESFSHKVQGYFKTLIKISEKMSKGDFSADIENNSKFEFGQIQNNLSEIKSYIIERGNFISDLLNNNYETPLVKLGENDELANTLDKLRERLSNEQKQQIQQDKDVEIRRYINEGLAKFADIMRINSNDTDALGDELIKNLVKYVGALQGSLFLIDDEDEQKINLRSSFAFDRKKYLKKVLYIGEGLVGTCAIEKKTINITEVPESYISIKSGLGDTPPNNVLILPVKNEETLVGVIELASLKLFSHFEIDLAEQIADNLASTVISVRNNAKTASLLETSQQQAAEMREQEEEMRQNMEELKATQEESSRREEAMQGLLRAVDSGFYQIEYNTDGKIENVNSKVTSFLEQPLESILGRTHQEVFSDSSIVTDAIINEISERKTSKRLRETLPFGSREIVYYHTLSPIVASTGAVIKILNLLIVDEN